MTEVAKVIVDFFDSNITLSNKLKDATVKILSHAADWLIEQIYFKLVEKGAIFVSDLLEFRITYSSEIEVNEAIVCGPEEEADTTYVDVTIEAEIGEQTGGPKVTYPNTDSTKSENNKANNKNIKPVMCEEVYYTPFLEYSFSGKNGVGY